jgi:hypothetical protein
MDRHPNRRRHRLLQLGPFSNALRSHPTSHLLLFLPAPSTPSLLLPTKVKVAPPVATTTTAISSELPRGRSSLASTPRPSSARHSRRRLCLVLPLLPPLPLQTLATIHLSLSFRSLDGLGSCFRGRSLKEPGCDVKMLMIGARTMMTRRISGRIVTWNSIVGKQMDPVINLKRPKHRMRNRQYYTGRVVLRRRSPISSKMDTALMKLCQQAFEKEQTMSALWGERNT